jgi:hypothetical protein
MKKIFVTSVLALATFTASAVDLGVNVGRDLSDPKRNYGGVSLSHSVGPVSAAVGFQRTSVGNNDQNRYSVVGGYDLVKVGKVQFTPVVGVSYIDNQNTVDGYAMTVGMEMSLPINKRLDGVVDLSYQVGQSRIKNFNGGGITTGIRYKF